MRTHDNVTQMLSRLLITENEMVEACRGAIERLESSHNRDRVFELLSSHRARANAITQLLHHIDRGADGPAAPRVQMGDSVEPEDDELVLRRLQRQNIKSESAYAAALQAAQSLPAEVSEAVEFGLQDARRWGEWLNRVDGTLA